MPKAFSEQEKELISQRLLEQGYKLFSTYGLKKTNVEEIAGAAGISKGAFYRFYESKEALFMDVMEEIETRFRQEIFAVIDLPGPTPRARLYSILKAAFRLVETIPIFHYLSGMDIPLLFRKVPAQIFQEHMTNDRIFLNEFVSRCRGAGIPIQVDAGQIIGLLYPLVLSILHADSEGLPQFGSNIDLLLELVAAFCLGEVDAQLQEPGSPALD